MFNIPYYFKAFPDEFLTDEFLDDPIMMKLIRYIMKRIRPYPHEADLDVNRQKRKIPLLEFQWIFGREKAAAECGTTENIIRHRMSRLKKLNFIQEITSSSESTFTVYRLMTESFSVISPAVPPADITSSYCFQNTSKVNNSKKRNQQFSPAVPPAVATTKKKITKEIKEPTNQPSINGSSDSNLVGGGFLELEKLALLAIKDEIPVDFDFLKSLWDDGNSIKAIKQLLAYYKGRIIKNDLQGMTNPRGHMRTKIKTFETKIREKANANANRAA